MTEIIYEALQEGWPARKLARRLSITEAEAQQLLDAEQDHAAIRQHGLTTAPLTQAQKIALVKSGLAPEDAAREFNCTLEAALTVLEPRQGYTPELVAAINARPDTPAQKLAKELRTHVEYIYLARKGHKPRQSLRDKVIELFHYGLTRQQAEAVLDCSYQTVAQHWPVKREARSRVTRPDNIHELLKHGTQQQVAAQLGVSQATVCRWAKEK